MSYLNHIGERWRCFDGYYVNFKSILFNRVYIIYVFNSCHLFRSNEQLSQNRYKKSRKKLEYTDYILYKDIIMFKKKDYDKEMLNILKRSKKHTCLYLDCSDKTIYSHAISSSISISKITEDGHVKKFKPIRYGCEKKPKFSDVGINEATAFNGFCHLHDNFFNDVDVREINNLREIYLQIYRSLSCFYYHEKIGEVLYPDVDINEMIEIFEEQRRAKDNIDIGSEKLIEVERMLKDKLINLNETKNNELIKIKIEVEKVRNYFLNNIYELDDRKYINRKLNGPGTELQTIKFYDFDYVLFYYKTDFQIPVAINTMHNLNYKGRSFLFFYIVIPYESSNIIIGVMEKNLPSEYYEKITSFIDGAFKNKLSTLNFIEALVISSPDDTYFKPCVINKMSNEKLDFILNDFMFLHEHLAFDKYFTEYDVSIFDELRRGIIAEECGTSSENNLDKINILPERESIDKRKEKMMNKINHENLIIKLLNEEFEK